MCHRIDGRGQAGLSGEQEGGVVKASLVIACMAKLGCDCKDERGPTNPAKNRAAIVLERKPTVLVEGRPGIPGYDDPSAVECSPEVLKAAQKSFGIKTPGPFNFDNPGHP